MKKNDLFMNEYENNLLLNNKMYTEKILLGEKKLLVFTSTFPTFLCWDATPWFVYDLTKRLSKLWLNIVVLTPRLPWTKKYEKIEWIKIYRFPYFFMSKLEKLNDWAILPNIKKNKLLLFQVPFLLLAWLINLIKIVKKEKIEIIHAHWIIPQGFLSVIYKKIFNKNIKILTTSHWSDINSLNSYLWTFIKKHTLKNIDKTTVVSKDLYEKSINLWVNKKNISIIPMWIDTKLFSYKNYDEKIKKKYEIKWKFLLFVWRLVEEKWVIYLIKAMKWVVKKYNNIKLIIVWTWPLENELKKEVSKLKLEKNIIFTKHIQNSKLPKYYTTADIFVWPSLKEGLWLVYIESILSWTVVIWTDSLWIKDIIKEWKTWYIVKKWNIKEIEETIFKILKKEDINIIKYREDIKQNFSLKIVSKNYYNLISKL